MLAKLDPRIDNLRDLVQAHAIPVTSAVLGEHNNGGLATWWRGVEADEEVRRAIDFTVTVGASVLLVPFFFFNEPKGASHRKAVAERLKPLAAHAERAGVILAYEGVTAAAHLLEMAAIIASPAFGVYFDMANVLWCDRDPAEEIRVLGPLIRQSHVKDALKFTGDARPGKGHVDHRRCAAAFRRIGYDGWLILETPGGTDQQIAEDLATARDFYSGS